MEPITSERAIRFATASVEMEGYKVTAKCQELCREILSGKLSYSEYLSQLTKKEEANNGI